MPHWRSTNPPEGYGRPPTPRRDLGNTPVPKSRRGFSSSDMGFAAICFAFITLIGAPVVLVALMVGLLISFE
jgi:hypothetical protein